MKAAEEQTKQTAKTCTIILPSASLKALRIELESLAQAIRTNDPAALRILAIVAEDAAKMLAAAEESR